ncbi:hypothetical protein, partial [Legionella londiniensis]|uniref:hypothetical protein n=1 Tax=Legionella londiniensis TaxID=45068 RepID=UPI00399CF6C2
FNLLTTRRLTLVIVNRRPDNYPDTAGILTLKFNDCLIEQIINYFIAAAIWSLVHFRNHLKSLI